MREIQPDLRLSTRSYTIDDIPLCTLGVPFRMIHCDFELSFFLMDYYGKISSEMMKFWLPSLEPQVYKPLFAKNNKIDLFNEEDNEETLVRKVALLTDQTVEAIQEQFELLGYPVCPEFHFIDNEEKLKQLQSKWDIKANEIPVLVTMGKSGTGAFEQILEDLLADSGCRKNIKYIFVCGRNTEVRKRLHQTAASKKKTNFSFHGLLTPQEMNELMNLCPLQVSKPGGAVTSEALETGISLLIMCSLPWRKRTDQKWKDSVWEENCRQIDR